MAEKDRKPGQNGKGSESRVSDVKKFNANYDEIVWSDPAIMLGKPCIRGTRITVESIKECLAAGETVEDILKAHPRLTKEQILSVKTGERRAA